MIIDPTLEKKTLKFLMGLVTLYDDNGVTTLQDHDYCSFVIDGNNIGFDDYNGAGYIVHYPRLDKEASERVQEIGEELFGSDLVKRIDKPDADKVYDASPIRYGLRCYVYSDSIVYVVFASAYNEKSNTHEDREKPINIKRLME